VPPTTTVSLPSVELEPFMLEALESARAVSHSFTVRDALRLTDAVARESGDSRPVHEQTLRKLLNDHPQVHRRLAHADERPGHVSRNTKLYLYSLETPVPTWDPVVSARFETEYPDPREVPFSGRRRARTSVSGRQRETRAVDLSERAQLICSLVTELVKDTETQSYASFLELEQQLATALEDVDRLSIENTKLKQQMKAVQRAAKLLDFANDSA